MVPRAIAAIIVLIAGQLALAQSAFPTLRLELAWDKLHHPVQVTHDGTERLFIVEQPGCVRIVIDGKMQPEPYLDLTNVVFHQGECGLLGLEFHPDFSRNGYLYVNYTIRQNRQVRTIISEFRALPNARRVSRSTERIIMTIDQPFANHNGGQIKFGPDGMLYIGMGDGGSANDPINAGQDLTTLLGKMLRIDVTPRRGYAVPPDNPFVGREDARPEIWAWGLRNPWRFSFDRETGICYAGDVGQNHWEEIDVIVKGGNYGWRPREGFHATPTLRTPEEVQGPYIDPIADYGRDEGLSVTGGYVYRGRQFPSLVGLYIYADYATGRFWALRYEDGNVTVNQEIDVTIDGVSAISRIQPSGFGEDNDGELYVCGHTRGNVYRIVAE